jgi:phosphatidylserine/phosphatidylglycerophosphate/cardiolipin synthase-like enzyme
MCWTKAKTHYWRRRDWLIKQKKELNYFILSTDNICIFALEALLHATDRGVKVSVIVDDLLIDATDIFARARQSSEYRDSHP